MRLLVTCGPTWEPLDHVRGLTNHSTGTLGTVLSRYFAERGHAVCCLRGTRATHPAPGAPVEVRPFTTIRDLDACFSACAAQGAWDAVLHAAALGDFELDQAEHDSGAPLNAGKWDSRAGGITLHLRPAPKLLPSLPARFPGARVIGWKFETDGGTDHAVERARVQIRTCGTQACVVNGPAWGDGFGVVTRNGVAPFPDALALAGALEQLLA